MYVCRLWAYGVVSGGKKGLFIPSRRYYCLRFQRRLRLLVSERVHVHGSARVFCENSQLWCVCHCVSALMMRKGHSFRAHASTLSSSARRSCLLLSASYRSSLLKKRGMVVESVPVDGAATVITLCMPDAHARALRPERLGAFA